MKSRVILNLIDTLEFFSVGKPRCVRKASGEVIKGGTGDLQELFPMQDPGLPWVDIHLRQRQQLQVSSMQEAQLHHMPGKIYKALAKLCAKRDFSNVLAVTFCDPSYLKYFS